MNAAGGAPHSPPARDDLDRRQQFAAVLRSARNTVGQQVARGMGARWRPEDVGTDLTSGVVAEECQRLATTLAFAVDMNDATLFSDEIEWLARMFQIRGYDSVRFMPRILDAYEEACRSVGSPEAVSEFVTPVLDAARRMALPAEPAAGGSAEAG